MLVALRMVLLMTLLTGILYPLGDDTRCKCAVPRKASGSVLRKGGVVIGSELLGQNFRSDRYFWPRPSAIDYSPLPSGGSTMAPAAAP